MYSAYPADGGRFYLRLLLTEVTGCKAYDCAKTLPNGTVREPFRDAAASRGLLHDDRDRYLAFEEACPRATTSAISRLFATILAYCSTGSPRTMWNTFSPHLSAEVSEEAIEVAVFQPDEDLRAVGSSLAAFPSVPKISHFRTNAPEKAQSPEFAAGPQKVFAYTHTPYLTMSRQ